MNNLPEKTKQFGLTIANFVKAIGPLIISQSEKASEAFAKHKARQDSIDVMKEILTNEAKIYQSIKEELLQRCLNADDIERIRIKRDLREIDESLRTLIIGQKALLFLPEFDEKQGKLENLITQSRTEISSSWLDRFNELAKLNNELWREDLLARALAKETISPGSVSPRVLWLIGTLEEKLFHAFASLLDISVFIDNHPVIPGSKLFQFDTIVPDCILEKDLTIGRLVYLLDDAGLIAEEGVMLPVGIEETSIVQYGTERFDVICKIENTHFSGLMYTGLGNSIASFYDIKPNKLGYDNFHNWLNSLKKEHFEITKTN